MFDEKVLDQAAEEIFRASYIVSKKKAGYWKTFSEYEFMKECLIELADTRGKKTFAEVSLSRRTVGRQIDAIAVIKKVDFGKVVETCLASSIALDESSDIIETAMLAIFIRAVIQNCKRLACTEALYGCAKKTQS